MKEDKEKLKEGDFKNQDKKLMIELVKEKIKFNENKILSVCKINTLNVLENSKDFGLVHNIKGEEMRKLILIMLIVSCSKVINISNFKNKDINEDLAIAIIKGQKYEAIRLINKGADVNYQYNNVTILELASNNQNLDIVENLLKKGAEPSKNNIIKFYDLALENFNYNVIDMIKDKFKLEEGLIDKNKYFLFLCYTSNAEELKKFIEKNNINPKEVKDKINRNGLIISAFGNKLDIVKMLIEEYELNIHNKNDNGDTPLIAACTNNNNKIVELLLEKGADVNCIGDLGRTALSCASKRNGDNKSVIEMLLDAGADINHKQRYGDTPLINASINGNLEIVKLLIKKGANIDKVGQFDYTPLMWAIRDKNLEVMTALIEGGANINHRYRSEPILFIAIECKYIEAVELLIKKGVNLNVTTHYYTNHSIENALIFIAKKMKESMTNKNKKNKLSPKKKVSVKETENSENYYIDVIRLLIKNGININYEDQDKLSCLYYAFMYENSEIVKELIKAGINIYEKDKYNKKTALMYVSEKIKDCKNISTKDNYIEIAYLIVKRMAEDYIQLFISMNKNSITPQESKDEVNNHINILYSLQKLPKELFIEIIKIF